jgi:cell division protein FtsB
VFSILPVRQYLDRREDVKEAALTLDAIQNEIAGLKKQVELATDKVIVERRAREDMSLVREGDKLYRLSIDPSDALKLPVDWPLPGLRHLLIGD